MEDLIIQKPALNKKFFKIGEAVKIHSKNKGDFDALILSIEDNSMVVVNVKWDSPMTGSSDYIADKTRIWIEDIKDGLITIEKYSK